MFRDLPVVLIDIVTSFAWDMPYEEVFLLTCIACEVNQWQLPEMFIRKHRTDWSLLGNRQSPLRIFSPQFSPETWFRFDIVHMLLDMLDFRRKDVREHGDRATWVRRVQTDWTTIHSFLKDDFRSKLEKVWAARCLWFRIHSVPHQPLLSVLLADGLLARPYLCRSCISRANMSAGFACSRLYAGSTPARILRRSIVFSSWSA